MSSYRGAGGAWDGGPPGAESDYASQHAPYASAAPPRAVPTTDPWTGVSYNQYGTAPTYDYQSYESAYNYNYDPSYYQAAEGYYKYSESRPYQPPHDGNYDYPSQHRERSRSPGESRNYSKRSYRSNSQSISHYIKRERSYSRKRDSSYEEGSRLRKSRSRSPRRRKYSTSDNSSTRSHSYSSKKDKKKRHMSSDSSGSERSYRRKSSKSRERNMSYTPPPKVRSTSRSHISRSHKTPSVSRSGSTSSRDDRKKRTKSHVAKDKKLREVLTPPKKVKKSSKKHKSSVSPKSYKRTESSVTPPRSYKKENTLTPPRKPRESSVTPPKSYARNSSYSSKSHSRSSTPRRKRSASPRARRTKSRSASESSASSIQSRDGQSKHRTKKKNLKNRSRSNSKRSSRSTSRRRSKSRGKGRRSVSPKDSQSRSASRSSHSRSRSRSNGASDDDRRGQFTVADRKRFWKLHRSRIEERGKESKTPPKEVKPPPGAIEATHVDDIEYGDPPEVEGPNFAELLPMGNSMMQQPSSSKSKAIPIPIKNDGSFLEMFKKMQEVTKKEEIVKKPEIKKPTLPFIGKRRGGRVLKTGLVKKAKAIDEQTVDNTPKDAWSLYMQEVKKYRETSCEEERKTRPLVK